MTPFLGTKLFGWVGVVEDRNDPLKLGRVRVRIAGLHSSKLVEDSKTGEGIPVLSLPWAYPGMPITSASMNGIGDTPIGPVEGTWVGGFSRDGRACQNLIYTYTLPGISQTAPINDGFNDTAATIPAANRPHTVGSQGELFPRTNFIKEPDTNRLARNQNINQTIVKKKRDTEDKNVPTSTGATWNELTTAYNAKYPFNRVNESESGHITEVDDTPGAERLHRYHRTGTFEEIHPDGSKVTKVVKDNYEIVAGSDFVHVMGDVNVTINGNCNLLVDKNLTTHVKGNYNLTADGNITMIGTRIDLNP